MTIDMPYGWTPQPQTNIDPSLECDLKDIQDDETTRLEFIELITEKLKTVYDPEISIDIYNLGLIYDVSVDKKNVSIKMTLTTPNCPVAESLPKEVKDSVMEIKGVDKVDLDLVWEPPWDKSMMSESAKLELNL